MNTIIKPIISEKSMSGVTLGRFTFQVLQDATKEEVKKAIEKKFKVNVLGVKTNLVKGKTTKVGKRRREVVKSSWKKAVVQLKEGQKIDLFDIGGEK